MICMKDVRKWSTGVAIALLATVATVSFTTPTYAETATSGSDVEITLSPTKVRLPMEPGASKQDVFKVINTGDKDFTFKVKKSSFKDKHYTHVYVEQGYLQFVYLGFYWEGKIYKKGGIEVKTPAAVSFAWIFRMVEINKLQKLEENVEFYHTGKCCKCGKTLTDALSIQLGLGPQCRNQ